jgi:hypothetical protein
MPATSIVYFWSILCTLKYINNVNGVTQPSGRSECRGLVGSGLEKAVDDVDCLQSRHRKFRKYWLFTTTSVVADPDVISSVGTRGTSSDLDY